jgi:hypothetical protein
VVTEAVVVEEIGRIERAPLVDRDALLDRSSKAHELLGPMADASQHVKGFVLWVAKSNESQVGLKQCASVLDYQLGDFASVAEPRQLAHCVV